MTGELSSFEFSIPISTVYILISVAAFVLLVTIYIKNLVSGIQKRGTFINKLYLCLALLAATDIIWVISEFIIFPDVTLNTIINYIINSLRYIFLIAVSVCWVLFYNSSTTKIHLSEKAISIVLVIPSFIVGILILTSYWSHLILDFTPEGEYIRGVLFFIPYLLAIAYNLFAMVQAGVNACLEKDHDTRHYSRELLLALIPYSVTLVMQLCAGFNFAIIGAIISLSLVSVEDLRHKKTLSDEIHAVTDNLAYSYESVYAVNLAEDSFRQYGRKSWVDEKYPENVAFSQSFGNYIESDVMEEDRDILREFLNYQAFRNRLEKKEYFSIKYRDTHTGSPLWFEMGVVAVKQNTDNIILTFQDIDEQVHTEKKIQNLGLSKIISAIASDYDIIVGIDNIYGDIAVYRNKMKEGLLSLFSTGRDYSRILEEYASSLVVEEDRDKLLHETSLETIRDTLETLPALVCKYRLNINGEIVWYETKIVKTVYTDGNIYFIVGARNINAEVLAEQEREREANRAREIINAISQDISLVCYIDTETNEDTVFRIDAALSEKLSGWETITRFDERLSYICRNFVLPEDRKQFIEDTAKEKALAELQNNSSYYVSWRITGANGNVEYWRLKFVPATDNSRYVIAAFSNADAEKKREIEQKAALEREVNERTLELNRKNLVLNRMNEDMVDLLGNIVESRDSESGQHIRRVKKFTRILATAVMTELPEYGLDEHQVELITSAAALHDVGKISISDAILLKPGRLTPEEFEVMKTHCVKGCEILKTAPIDWSREYLDTSLIICRYHHEKWDGKGYPDGLKGDSIPIAAQIVSIADIYDALITRRCYKEGMSPDMAYQMIVSGQCGAFSEKLLGVFAACKDKFAACAVDGDNPDTVGE